MNKQIYLNTHTSDLKRAITFFEGLGFTFDPKFTDENAGALIISPDITIMILNNPFFKGFIGSKEVVDTTKNSEMIICINAETREAVDQLVEKAFELGAAKSNEPYDYGWMYGRSFLDLDGHNWEVAYLDPAGPQPE